MIRVIEIIFSCIGIINFVFWMSYWSNTVNKIQFLLFLSLDIIIKYYFQTKKKKLSKKKTLKLVYYYYKIITVLQFICATKANMRLSENSLVTNNLCLVLFNKLYDLSENDDEKGIFQIDIEFFLFALNNLQLLPLTENNILVIQSFCISIGIFSTLDSLSTLKEKKDIRIWLKYFYLVYRILFKNNLLEMYYYFFNHINSKLRKDYSVEDSFIFLTIFALRFTEDRSFYTVFIAYELYKSFEGTKRIIGYT